MEIIESDISREASLPSVDPSEIAFAMALFVAAAKGRIHGPGIGVSGFPSSESRLDPDDDPLDIQDLPGDVHETSSESMPLGRAGSVLWHHYKGDERQRTIWCRVVAFHVMMVRCQGSLVKPWTTVCTKDEDTAFLDPAVVYAVATASLREFGQFSDDPFLEAVKQFTGQAPVALESDSFVAQKVPQSRIFDSLRRSVADLAGRRGFQSLLSRAIVGPSSKFPWLRSAQDLTPGDLFERIDQSSPYMTATEAAEAENAVVASMVDLLNVLLGEGVTARLLQNAWAKENARHE